MVCNLKSRDLFVALLFVQFAVNAVILFNVSVARQVIVFLYFTFVPGIVIMQLLKVDSLDMAETVLLSVGLSVASLMLIGLVTNELSHLIGVSQPLLSIPLLVTLNGFTLIGTIIGFLRNQDLEFSVLKARKVSYFPLLIIVLPILGIVGALLVNINGGNLVLLAMILLSVAIFAFSVLSNRFASPKLYPLIIFLIAIALLFHSTLISNYIYGSDIHTEYYSFKLTQNNAYWHSAAYFPDPRFGRFNTMLSITILPTIYSNLLNLDGTWVYKICFPLIFSFVALGLYKMWRIGFNSKTALISTFLLMSELTFYTEMPGVARQMIAELFFVLLFFVLLNKKLNPKSSKVLFIIFGIALVVSHYGLALIFLFFISAACVYMYLSKRKCKTLTLTMVGFFFVAMFSWYIYTSASASFESILSFGNHIWFRLGEFFNPASRGTGVMRGLGLESVQSYWQISSRMFAYATQFFIVVGFVALMARRKRENPSLEYSVFSSLGMVLLAMCILLPSFASSLNMTRFYHIILFFIAPFFVLGCEALVQFLARQRRQLYVLIVALMILLPYFLFQTGFVYEVTGSDVWSLPLSKYRMDKLQLYAYHGYVDEQSVFGAQWVSKNINIKRMQVYADSVSRYKALTSYGMIYEGAIHILSNTTIVPTNGIIYLGTLNVLYGEIVGKYVWNSSELDFLFDDGNKVYTNGGSEVYISVVGTQ